MVDLFLTQIQKSQGLRKGRRFPLRMHTREEPGYCFAPSADSYGNRISWLMRVRSVTRLIPVISEHCLSASRLNEAETSIFHRLIPYLNKRESPKFGDYLLSSKTIRSGALIYHTASPEVPLVYMHLKLLFLFVESFLGMCNIGFQVQHSVPSSIRKDPIRS